MGYVLPYETLFAIGVKACDELIVSDIMES